MLVLAPPMASCRCPRRVLLGLCDHKPREFLAQHQQLQRYPRDLWSYKFKFTHPPLPSMIRWTIICLVGDFLPAWEGFSSPTLPRLSVTVQLVQGASCNSMYAVVAEGTHDTKPAGLLTGQVSRVPLSQHLLPRHSTLIFGRT